VAAAPRSVSELNMITGKRRYVLRKLGQGRQAVHFRHLDVENDHVRIELGQLLQGNTAVRRGADHFESGIARQLLGNEPPKNDGIIHDENAKFGHDSFLENVEQVKLRNEKPLEENGFMRYSLAPAFMARVTWSISVSEVTIRMRRLS